MTQMDPELHCGPISMTQKNGNSPVLTAKVDVGMKHIAWNLSLVAQSSSVERRVAPGLVRHLWCNWVFSWEGASYVRDLWENIPAAERHSLRLFTCKKCQEKGKQEWQLLARHSPQWKRLSRHVSEVKRGGTTNLVSNRNRMAKMLSLRTAQTHQAEIKKKIKANDKLRKILTNMPEEHRVLIYGNSFKSKMQSLDDEKAASLAAKRQFGSKNKKNHLERVSKEIESKQKKRLEILQTWIEADQELDAANSKQIQAEHEMAMLVAEQSAENAKTVNQGNPGFQTHTSGSISDQAAKQTVLSVFKSVLSMQSMECHGVSEQLMAAGATEEDVKKMSQVMAQTVRKLETGNATPEPGPKAHSLPCEVVGSDEEFRRSMRTWIQQNGHRGPRSHQEEPVKWHHRKEAIGKEMQTGRRRFVTFSVSGSGLNSLQCLFILRFPELVKRITQDLHAPQRSCSATNSEQLASGLRI